MKKIISIFTLSILLSSCSVYKMDVEQGNSISNETVSQLRKGMTKAEVSTLLGNPLLQDSFRNNRWDYIYYNGQGTNSSKQQSLTLMFANHRLIQVSH